MTISEDRAIAPAPPALAPAPAEALDAPAGDGAPPAADPQLRARLMTQFEQWLDEMLAPEPPPRGVPEELLDEPAGAEADSAAGAAGDVDAYSLLSALTALTGEIRLQGRAFKQLSDLVAPLADAAPALRELPDAQRRSAEAITKAIDELSPDPDALAIPAEQICQTLIDLYDRLDRGMHIAGQGIEAVQSAQPRGMFWRWAGGPAFARRAAESAQALRDANALLLARLQSAMREWGIERIGTDGEQFDPRRMAVVDVRPGSDAEPGTVIEVLGSGYSAAGQIQAVARVAVAK